MFTALRIFKEQKKANTDKKLVRFPFRYFFRWRKSLLPGASSVKDQQPWITFQAMDFLAANLAKNDAVFEYGGGGSTLFFLSRVKEVVTVEHNREWFEVLKKIAAEKKNASWKGNFIAAEPGNIVDNPDPSEPAHYSSADEPSKGMNYRNYVCNIDSFNDGYFSCVIVDGRSRPACIAHAIAKIRKNGFLVLDNSDRAYYLTKTLPLLKDSFQLVMDEVGPSPYSRSFTKTNIWRKIK
jgi:hypothetical protein